MDYKAATDKEIIAEALRRFGAPLLLKIAGDPDKPPPLFNQIAVWKSRALSKKARARLEQALAESEVVPAAAVMKTLRQMEAHYQQMEAHYQQMEAHSLRLEELLVRLIELTEQSSRSSTG